MKIQITHTYSDGRPDSIEVQEIDAYGAWLYHALWCHVCTVKSAVLTNAL